MKKICFVCLGNICRSPMAEFVMREAASDASLEIASRATSGWEHGNPIHRGTQGIFRKYKIAYEKGVARAAGDVGSYYYDEKKDVETAKKWIQMAIDGGDVDSNFYLGEIYEDAGDLRQALKYYSIPANNKKAIAMSIARSLASELGDKKLADYWYNKIFSEPGIEQLSEQLVIGLGK